MRKKLEIYTDGACRGNPGPGGFGLVVLDGDRVIYRMRRTSADTTNNRMELLALLNALDYASRHLFESFTIYSDSAYCVNICNDWIWSWAQQDWRNSKNKLIENDDIIREIYKYLAPDISDWSTINFQIVKINGHAGIPGNELADALATEKKDKYINLLLTYNIKDDLDKDFFD